MSKYFTATELYRILDEPFVTSYKGEPAVDLEGDKNPDPKGLFRDGRNKTWAESKRRGRGKIMEQVLQAKLAELSQYRGNPEYAVELEKQKKFKPNTPWIQIKKGGSTCYVDLEDGSLVPTKSADNVAGKDEIKKWEEASPEEKRVIVDDVLKILKIRRVNRECTRKGRANKRNEKSTKKKSAAAAAASTAPVAAAGSSSSTTQSSEPNVTHNHHHHHHHHHHHNTTNINTQGNGKVNINV